MFNLGKRANFLYFIGMLLPLVLLYLLLIIPIAKTFHLSLFSWDGITPPAFIGLKNFIKLMGDWRFGFALRNIAILIGVTIVFQVGLGILLAFFLTDLNLRHKQFYKNVIFLPVVISNVAVALYFVSVFDYQNGLLNHLMLSLGLERLNPLGSGAKTIWWAVIPQTWQYIGLMFIIAYTGFSTVESDYIDYSRLEGLTPLQRLRHIYLPISWDSVSICFMIALVGPLKAFEHIFILTSGGGGDQKSHIPATLMYYLGFDSYEYGYGSSIAVFICLLAVLLVVIFRFSTRRRRQAS